MDEMPIRVLIADDDELFSRRLAYMLAQEADIAVVGIANDVDDTLLKVAAYKPDVLLTDFFMRWTGGLPGVLLNICQYAETIVAILTSSAEDKDVLSAAKMGVQGYILKSGTSDEIAQAVRALARGDLFFVGRVLTTLRQEFSYLVERQYAAQSGPRTLSDQERHVLRLLASAASNEEIADELGISAAAVRVHIRAIMAKLRVRDRGEAAVYARQQGAIFGHGALMARNRHRDRAPALQVR
jgi:DNA-binding NarL/FixJ family response regulator